MTIATILAVGTAKQGPDKNLLPSRPMDLPVTTGNDISNAFNIEGFRALGLIDPGTLTGITAFQIHVSNAEAGTYAKLNIEDFVAGELLAYGTTNIAEWAWAKIKLIGTLAATDTIPLCMA